MAGREDEPHAWQRPADELREQAELPASPWIPARARRRAASGGLVIGVLAALALHAVVALTMIELERSPVGAQGPSGAMGILDRLSELVIGPKPAPAEPS